MTHKIEIKVNFEKGSIGDRRRSSYIFYADLPEHSDDTDFGAFARTQAYKNSIVLSITCVGWDLCGVTSRLSDTTHRGCLIYKNHGLTDGEFHWMSVDGSNRCGSRDSIYECKLDIEMSEKQNELNV